MTAILSCNIGSHGHLTGVIGLLMILGANFLMSQAAQKLAVVYTSKHRVPQNLEPSGPVVFLSSSTATLGMPRQNFFMSHIMEIYVTTSNS